jgi:hypothetical protein
VRFLTTPYGRPWSVSLFSSSSWPESRERGQSAPDSLSCLPGKDFPGVFLHLPFFALRSHRIFSVPLRPQA